MLRKQFKTVFFVDRSGVALEKAKPVNAKLRRAIFERDQYRCRYCDSDVSLFRDKLYPFKGNPVGHVDHIFPRSRGGQNEESNLQLLCERCNLSKGGNA